MNRPDKGRMTHFWYYRRTIQKRERFFHRVQIDLAFMGQNKKNYGFFFIGKVPAISPAVSPGRFIGITFVQNIFLKPIQVICSKCGKPKKQD